MRTAKTEECTSICARSGLQRLGRFVSILMLVAAVTVGISAADPKAEDDVLQYTSPGDGTMQPAIMVPASSRSKPRPLLVSLHTWSGSYRQDCDGRKLWCAQRDWHFIHPDFRGPNRRPEACGSDLVVADITGAVQYMIDNHAVDEDRIYLLGGSGGGHAALLMAGRAPELWAGVSAWVPISDLRLWYQHHGGRGYGKQIAKACGGKPGDSEAVDAEYIRRSPVTWLAQAKDVALDINGGLYDGRKGSVPFTESLLAFNVVAEPKDRIAQADIDAFYETLEVPESLRGEWVDPVYRKHTPVFRRISGKARVTIFKGGHQLNDYAALNWLALQRKGEPAVWQVEEPFWPNRNRHGKSKPAQR